MRRLLLFVFLTALAFTSCSHFSQIPKEDRNQFEDQFRNLLDDRVEQINNAAYLVQVKVKTADFKKKFKLEIYYQNDSISFYSPGFWGKGTFKGILHEDSLNFYIPSERVYYSGLWYNLTETDAQEWRVLLEHTINLIKGNPLPEELHVRYESRRSYNWRTEFFTKSNKVKSIEYKCYQVITNSTKVEIVSPVELRAELDLAFHSNDFPFFNFSKLDIKLNPVEDRKNKYNDRVRVDFIRQKYNIDIPREKFELYIPESAEQIDKLVFE